MRDHFDMLFELILLLISLICLAIYVNERNNKAKLPPGEFGWPIIGKIPSRNETIHKRIEEYRKKYGNVFTWKIGSINFVFLCDFKSVKAAFSNPDLQDRPNFFTLRSITFNKMIGLINGMGIQWQNTRRFTLRHLRNMGMGKTTMEDAITSEIEGLVADFKKYTNELTEIPISINASVMNVLWRLIAGKTYDIESKETLHFQNTLTNVFNQSQGDLLLFDVLPWLVPLTPQSFKIWMGFNDYKKDIDTVFSLLKSVVEEHKADLKMEEPRDVVEAYLQEMKLYQEEGKGDFGSTFNEEGLQSTLLDMFAAGSDTTSHTIRWVLLYLAQYTEVQSKVQKEIDEQIPREKMPTLADRDSLPYTNATYHEVARMIPQAPLGKYHAAGADTKIFDYFIPKGTVIVSSIQSCHIDPEYWDNPMEFRPERFLHPDGSFNGKRESYLPFSIGRRYCLGESLAKMEVFLVTTALLQNFTFSAPNGETLNLEPDPRQPLFNIPSTIKVNIRVRE